MIVYLHGLNSSSRSNKAVAQLTRLLSKLSRRGGPPVLVGSSMGGFYGQYLARRLPIAHLFMFNPALQPWELLPDYAETPMVTAAGETYQLTSEIIASTRAYGVDEPCGGDADGVPTTLFLERGDEIIDYRIARELYKDCGRVIVFTGGNHGFAHMPQAIDIIRCTLNGSHGSAA